MRESLKNIREKLLEAVERREEENALRLYRGAAASYTIPGSGRLREDGEFWSEINWAIEAVSGPEALEQFKASASPRSEPRTTGGQQKGRLRLPRWASARKATRYAVAIDDSGQKAVRPSVARRCFVLGGVVLRCSQIERLRYTWTARRDGQEEIKARNYISSLGFENHLDWAEALLSIEMDHWGALPVWIAFDKSEAGPDVTIATRKGGRRIDVSKGITLLACSLASHFQHVEGCAESVFMDHMSSESEELALQEEWRKTRGGMSGTLRRTLPTELTFVDSATNPEIQVADVVAGILRAAHEERRPIAPGLTRLLRRAEDQRLFGFHTS